MKAILLTLLQTKQNEAKLLNTRLVQLADELKHIEQSLKLESDVPEETTVIEVKEEPKAKAKKVKPQPEVLAPSEGEDDLNTALGDGPGKPEKKLTADDVREALKQVTSERGAAGLTEARAVMARHTKGGTSQIKDLAEAKYRKVIEELKGLL